jgi:hypothetical protein
VALINFMSLFEQLLYSNMIISYLNDSHYFFIMIEHFNFDIYFLLSYYHILSLVPFTCFRNLQSLYFFILLLILILFSIHIFLFSSISIFKISLIFITFIIFHSNFLYQLNFNLKLMLNTLLIIGK